MVMAVEMDIFSSIFGLTDLISALDARVNGDVRVAMRRAKYHENYKENMF